MSRKFLIFGALILGILCAQILYLSFAKSDESARQSYAKLGIAGFALSHGCFRHVSTCERTELFISHPALFGGEFSEFGQNGHAYE